jgi:hypothetical protein
VQLHRLRITWDGSSRAWARRRRRQRRPRRSQARAVGMRGGC